MPSSLKILGLEKISIFFAFLLPSIIVSFLSVTHTSSSWLIGGLATVTVITYLVLTKTPIVALGLKLKWQSLLAILPGTSLIAIVQLLFLAVIPWLQGLLI